MTVFEEVRLLIEIYELNSSIYILMVFFKDFQTVFRDYGVKCFLRFSLTFGQQFFIEFRLFSNIFLIHRYPPLPQSLAVANLSPITRPSYGFR